MVFRPPVAVIGHPLQIKAPTRRPAPPQDYRTLAARGGLLGRN